MFGIKKSIRLVLWMQIQWINLTEHLAKCIADYEKENAKDGLIYGEGIKEECKIMDTFFDETFEPGTARKMFGATHNLADRTSAVKKLYNLSQKQLKEHKEKVEEIARMATGADAK